MDSVDEKGVDEKGVPLRARSVLNTGKIVSKRYLYH
jgi:hypothetical protein